LFEELAAGDSLHPTHRDETAMNGAPGLHGLGETSVVETLPGALLKRLRLPGRLEALKAVHFPEAGTPMMELMSAASPGHRRLIFEELFYLELGLELKRRRMRERAGTAFVTNVKVREAIKQVLPFHPTSAQKGCWARLRRICGSRSRCGDCCREMWVRARRLWRCRRRWWRLRTDTRRR